MKPAQSQTTLSDVLHHKQTKSVPSEREWVELVRAVSEGDEGALHQLYERAHRPVFTLIVRITVNRESAEELTLDVFHDVWRKASRYDVADGTVLGWIMNQARSRALDRLRFDQRKKRVPPPDGDSPQQVESVNGDDLLELEQQRAALATALAVLTPAERQAIEAAFFSELTHAEVADRLNAPLGTIKTRIRSGLQKLRQAFEMEASEP